MNILLIEDDAGLVELITAILEESKFSVAIATSGEEALAHLEKQTPDLMLLDYSLPDTNGKELIESLNKQQILLPPFIITTGQGDERVAVSMMKLGAMDYLIKDRLFLEKLPDVVRRVIKEIESDVKLKQAEEALRQSEATVRNKLKAITEPEGDIGSLELADIIDVEVLQSMMENFYELTGMLGAVLDVSGKVLVAVGWQDICTKFHRCNPNSLKNCIESDTMLTNGVPEGTFKAYHCKNNMWDIVTPIMLGGRHVGNVFMGQYFLEDELPDYEFFRKQARKYGYNEKEYLAALDLVPHFSKETVDAGMQFYSKLAGIISKMSFSLIQQSRMLAEAKQAEEKILKAKLLIEENEKKYQDLINLAQEGIWVIDKNNITSFANPSMAMMLGYSPEDIIGKSLFDFMDETGVKVANKNIERRKTGSKEQHDFEFICKNGDRIFCTMATAPILDEDGNYKGAIAGVIDITNKKLVEERIRDSEEKYKALYENAPLSYQSLNEDGSFKDVNPFWLETLGYERSDVIGHKYADFLHPDWKVHFEKNFPAFKERGYVSDVQYKIRHKKGHYIDISFEGCIGYNPDGSFRQTYCVFQDITARKQAEEKLKISEERLTTILNSSPFPIAVVDVNDDNIQYWSTSAKQLFGHEPKTSEEWYGLAYPDLNYRKEVIQRWKPYLEIAEKSSVAVNTGDYSIVCNDGSTKICEIYAQFIPESIIVTFNDITERKQAEELIRKNKKRLDYALKSIDTGAWELDLVKRDSWRSFEHDKIFGYSEPLVEWTFDMFLEHVVSEDREMVNENFTKAVSTKSDWDFECRINRKDGCVRWISGKGNHEFNPDKELAKMFGVVQDITEKKMAEEEIAHHRENLEELVRERTSDLEDKNKELERFNDLFVNRELRIKELRDELENLKK